MPHPTPQDGLVHSYLFLRRAIGVLGLGLPVLLVVGNLVAGDGLRDSISGYYHSSVRDLLVGVMCAIGVFLLSYRGYDRVDDVVANIAAVAAIGLALFPVSPQHPVGDDSVIGIVHLSFAGIFFLSLAFFSIVLFRRGDDPRPSPRKAARDRVYLTCGVVMLVCLVLMPLSGWVLDPWLHAMRPVLWLETVAVLAFGVSWLTKGETILGDHGRVLRLSTEDAAVTA
ncbi:hypothetical protein [Actinokineospora enzanensis]|uniref:hypothetical protein n=1 Tax=Actinokineospora enzanensis TaxID=155975 RepID=UPI000362A2A5|nr:hypothetical protein [Actinokineospora enzanensis]